MAGTILADPVDGLGLGTAATGSGPCARASVTANTADNNGANTIDDLSLGRDGHDGQITSGTLGEGEG